MLLFLQAYETAVVGVDQGLLGALRFTRHIPVHGQTTAICNATVSGGTRSAAEKRDPFTI